jgi:hypothetical protein
MAPTFDRWHIKGPVVLLAVAGRADKKYRSLPTRCCSPRTDYMLQETTTRGSASIADLCPVKYVVRACIWCKQTRRFLIAKPRGTPLTSCLPLPLPADRTRQQSSVRGTDGDAISHRHASHSLPRAAGWEWVRQKEERRKGRSS